jgi:hypothetical protein
MKTAVEWLADELCYITDNGRYIIDNTDDVTDVVNQAKEMEKEHISKAYFEGWCCPHGEGFPETGEQYYNETFTNSPEIPTSSKQQ